MKEELDWSVEYKEKIDKFEMNRKYLYEVFGLNQTLKMHVIKEHYVTYFKMTGKTLREVSVEYHVQVFTTHIKPRKKAWLLSKEGTGQCFTH